LPQANVNSNKIQFFAWFESFGWRHLWYESNSNSTELRPPKLRFSSIWPLPGQRCSGDAKVPEEESLNRDERGQGLTEYAAVIAFVAILVAITFGFSKGSLMPAVSGAFSAVAAQVNEMSAAGGSGV
jgi:Flp pilus assembly pilin Flp